ncbi:hypothetical protein ACIA8J_06410 [Streptomyces asoensis]|uniref:hypothetical protein n=1 Tax=Streptomyces asoensis TaxID=249586 RepID=UPI0037BA68D1
MGIRMLHRRKARARVHATAAEAARTGSDAAHRPRPRPARAPAAATARIPRTLAMTLRAAAGARARRLSPTGFLTRTVLREGGRPRRWAEAVRGRRAAALSALGRLRRPRGDRRGPVLVASADPLTGRRDDSAR